MSVRMARDQDAAAVAAIYEPIVRQTAISFELVPPTAEEMKTRIENTVPRLPWLVSTDGAGAINGYAYASKHRERAAYQWSVDTTVYVRSNSRGQGVGKALYEALFTELVALGYCQAFAGIALPNDASVRLHQSVGFTPIGVYRQVGFKLGRWHDVGWWQRPLRSIPVPEAPRSAVSSSESQ
jgi:L-amino acid N-acyltransferase YncA